MDALPRRSDGTIQTERVRQPWPKDRPFRILSIDGGGICGILPASVLSELERRFLGGKSIVGYFDLIAGTSTGGIIALGLGYGKTAGEINELYVKHGGKIFPGKTKFARCYRAFRRGYRYAYDRSPLECQLRTVFGESKFGDSIVRLCIPSFEGHHGEPWLYKTPHHPDYKLDRKEQNVRVALATAAAPTFFEALPNDGYVMVDGGLWANNPVMNALVDAFACFELERRQIQILTLGCGETSFTVDVSKTKGGLWQWRSAITAAMRAQSKNALGQAFLLVGKDHVTRLDAPESAKPIKLDDHPRASVELPLMARSLVEAAGERIRSTFLTTPAAAYTACPVP